jgi:predicted lipoprotein with Yx(FWY)xxD motif
MHRYRSTTARLAAPLVGLAALLAACGGGDEASTSAQERAAPEGAQIATAQTSLGEVLVDPSGRTLYAFTDDVDGVSTCYDTCATAWPPVDGTLAVAAGLEAVGFDTVTRQDGTTQLRAGGRWPLYLFAGDAGPGDVNGQASGDEWFAVGRDGALIGLDAPAGGAPTGTAAPAADGGLGPVLTDARGMTVYAFLKDQPGRSTCLDPCSQTWPPVREGELAASAAQVGEVGAIARPDGTRQATLDGRALYRYKDDKGPGDALGQGVGEVWFAVGADGEVLQPKGLRVGSTDAGDVLIDVDGFTVYTFANDPRDQSTCADPCISTWPAVPGDARIDASLDPSQFHPISRADGSSQLTLGGRPLYRFSGDVNPGDANGILVGARGTWSTVGKEGLVVAPAGGLAAAAPAPATTAPPAGVKVGESPVGRVLVDAEGRTLYGFTKDSEGTSACNDACADAWPPIAGETTVDAAVTAASKAITRADGSSQLALGKWPVYTFAGDTGPGDVNGQGSGGVWFAVAPDGTLIK